MPYHQPKKSLLAILRVVNELGGTSDKFAVHTAARIYKEINNTAQRLAELQHLGLLHRQSTGKEFVYFLTLKGSQILRMSFDDQCIALSKSEKKANTPKQCVKCYATHNLTWFKEAYYCERHLNEDTPADYSPHCASSLGWS